MAASCLYQLSKPLSRSFDVVVHEHDERGFGRSDSGVASRVQARDPVALDIADASAGSPRDLLRDVTCLARWSVIDHQHLVGTGSEVLPGE